MLLGKKLFHLVQYRPRDQQLLPLLRLCKIAAIAIIANSTSHFRHSESTPYAIGPEPESTVSQSECSQEDQDSVYQQPPAPDALRARSCWLHPRKSCPVQIMASVNHDLAARSMIFDLGHRAMFHFRVRLSSMRNIVEG